MSNINEQTLIEHLSEFRKRLIITIIFFIKEILNICIFYYLMIFWVFI